MGITVFLKYLVRRLFSKCFHCSLIGLRKNGIFIRCSLRSFAMVYHQCNPVAGVFLTGILHTRVLREVLLEFSCYGCIITRIYPILFITFIIFPEITVSIIFHGKLEDGRFRRIIAVSIFDIRTETHDCSIEEMVRFTGTMGTVIFVMFVKFHTEIPVHPFL